MDSFCLRPYYTPMPQPLNLECNPLPKMSRISPSVYTIKTLLLTCRKTLPNIFWWILDLSHKDLQVKFLENMGNLKK